nr:hypothetical protein [Kribbella pittospori]
MIGAEDLDLVSEDLLEGGHSGDRVARVPAPVREVCSGAESGRTARQSTAQSCQAEAAQTSERFSRSVEQLGSDAIAVRIGAVCAFANLMRDGAARPAGDRGNSQRLHPVPGCAGTAEGRNSSTVAGRLVAAFRVLDDQLTPRSRENADGTTKTWPSMLLSRADLHGFDLLRTG